MTPRILIPSALIALALTATAATAQDNDTTRPRDPYIIEPDTVRANVAFDLHLLSHRFNCGTTYSHQSIKIEGKTVTLTFLATEHPEALCPAVYMPYGPTYAMSPMAAGYYEVYARHLQSCMIGPGPQCQAGAMEPVPEFAGVLSVGVTDRRGWFIRPDEVEMEKPFTLHILNHAYGNCNTSFSHEMIEKRNGAFFASFVVEQHPERVCIADIRPHGPSFDIKGQPAGQYPVLVNVQHPCRYDTPKPCLASSPDRWIVIDTLKVVKGDPTRVKTGSQRFQPSHAVFPRGTLEGGWKADGRKALEVK